VPSGCRSTTWLSQILSKSVRGLVMIVDPYVPVRTVAGASFDALCLLRMRKAVNAFSYLLRTSS